MPHQCKIETGGDVTIDRNALNAKPLRKRIRVREGRAIVFWKENGNDRGMNGNIGGKSAAIAKGANATGFEWDSAVSEMGNGIDNVHWDFEAISVDLDFVERLRGKEKERDFSHSQCK
jgi:hypothetical protein